MDKYFLDKDEALLLIVDIQERLAAVMKDRDQVVRNCVHLIELAKMFKIPVMVTEQNPKGLGRTVTDIQESLPEYRPMEKLSFNCCEEPDFLDEIRKRNRRKIILAGMETHVCVLQTAAGLLREGFLVHAVADAGSSRCAESRSTGLEFMRDAGAVVTCTETVLFQLLKAAGTAEFRKISQRIK